MKICKVKNCDIKYYSKGYCIKHYYQIKRNGEILERTKWDRNKFILYDYYYKIEIYNQYNKIKGYALIDKIDYEICKDYKWHFDNNGYPKAYVEKKHIFLHNHIMNFIPTNKLEIDHLNRKPFDNRRKNLKVVTKSQNQFNRRKQKNNTSGYTGVVKLRDKWQAQICMNNKMVYLGIYKYKKNAIEARKKAMIDIANGEIWRWRDCGKRIGLIK